MSGILHTFVDLPIKVDFVLSLGQTCKTAAALRRNKLRSFSSPFDWMMNYNLETVSHFFNNGFDNFFKNYSIIEKNANHMVVKDLDTGMLSLHDFPSDMDAEQFHAEFIRKMTNRFNKTISKIKESDDILFVSNSDVKRYDEITCFIKNMDGLLYKKRIYYLNIYNNEQEKINISYINNAIFFDIQFLDDHKNGAESSNLDHWLGNTEKWDALLKFVKTKQPIVWEEV